MPKDIQSVWSAVLGEIELQISQANFETWIKKARVLGYESGLCTLGVQNAFTKERIEGKYQPMLERALSKHLDEDVKITCKVLQNEGDSAFPPNSIFANQPTFSQPQNVRAVDNIRPATSSTSKSNIRYSFNPRFTFSSFVVGSNSKLAHAASEAVAENPGAAYNPLFIYGDVGLGKTHLMHAIAQHVTHNNPDAKILYVSSEKFTNDLIMSIRSNSTDSFRKKYRDVDVLLIDDIQFIAGKETTQEEFFHTFNAVYEVGNQIVLTSDRPPYEIPTLEARLKSRFAAGLIADIQKPDFETRRAILENKVISKNLSVPSEVIDVIAQRVSSNIRELEGALIRIITHSKVHNLPVNVEVAADILSMVTPKHEKKAVSMKTIIQKVSDFYEIEEGKIIGKSRRHDIVLPRQIAMYLMREELGASLNQIGSE
ncbi:chromosomal replication initiator protein DnaA, partial [candidate division WWE3 bacterium]|nr:chromosomal replication initiator protein DnaA [candidate division WWE3 bacterium]